MFSAMIGGTLIGRAEARTSGNGRRYVTCRLRVTQDGGDSFLASAVAFADEARAALLALGDGEAITLAGQAKTRAWKDRASDEPRAGLDIVVASVLTAYHVRRKRDAVSGYDVPRAAADPGGASPRQRAGRDMSALFQPTPLARPPDAAPLIPAGAFDDLEEPGF